MGKLKRYGMIVTVVLLLWVTCCGCGRLALPEDYRQSCFDADLVWELEGTVFCGRAEVSEDGSVVLTMLSPDLVAGMRWERTGWDGTPRIGCDGVWAEGLLWEELCSTVALLLPRGQRTPVLRTERKGEEVLYVEIREALGGREEAVLCGVYLYSESGIPQAIVSEGRTVEIQRFAFGK